VTRARGLISMCGSCSTRWRQMRSSAGRERANWSYPRSRWPSRAPHSPRIEDGRGEAEARTGLPPAAQMEGRGVRCRFGDIGASRRRPGNLRFRRQAGHGCAGRRASLFSSALSVTCHAVFLRSWRRSLGGKAFWNGSGRTSAGSLMRALASLTSVSGRLGRNEWRRWELSRDRKAALGVIEKEATRIMPTTPQPDKPAPLPEPDVVRPPTPVEEPQPDEGPGLPQPGPDVVVPPGPEVITPPQPQEIPPGGPG
jgi:hypothetical protein